MKIEDRIFGVMSSFIAINDHVDKHMQLSEPMLKSRNANYGLIKIALTAEEFITESGLNSDYRKFEKKVNDKLGNLIAKHGSM